MGYEGAYFTMRKCLRFIRTAAPRQFERHFETPASKQTQMVFAAFQMEFRCETGVLRNGSPFSMLRHSRWLWARFCPNQTLMRCHVAAFTFGWTCTLSRSRPCNGDTVPCDLVA